MQEPSSPASAGRLLDSKPSVEPDTADTDPARKVTSLEMNGKIDSSRIVL